MRPFFVVAKIALRMRFVLQCCLSSGTSLERYSRATQQAPFIRNCEK